MRNLLFVLLVIMLSISFVAAAETFPSPQNKYVNDFANVLTSEERVQLGEIFYSIETETTAEVTFVSIENLSGYDISDYATKLATQWKIGKADKDNGLLILYSASENKIWVATGYGLEGILPDSKIGRLLDEHYVPLRDSGKVSTGILAFSSAISDVLKQNAEEIRSGQAGASNTGIDPFFVFIIIFIILSIISRILSSSKKRSGLWWIPIFLPFRSSGSGGIGGGGLGGGGFGGGGFGGGGAGR